MKTLLLVVATCLHAESVIVSFSDELGYLEHDDEQGYFIGDQIASSETTIMCPPDATVSVMIPGWPMSTFIEVRDESFEFVSTISPFANPFPGAPVGFGYQIYFLQGERGSNGYGEPFEGFQGLGGFVFPSAGSTSVTFSTVIEPVSEPSNIALAVLGVLLMAAKRVYR